MAVSAATAFLAAALLATQVAPFRSLDRLTSSNGYAPIVYDLPQRRIVSFRENMYRFPEPGVQTRDLAFDLYLGLRVAGQSRWLTEVALDEAGYEVGTGLIRTVQTVGDLRVTTHYVAPFGIDLRAMLVTATVENVGAAVQDVAVFSLHNFHVGAGNDATDSERIVWDAARGAYVESSAATGSASGTLVIKPISAIDGRTAGSANPYGLVNDNRLFGQVDDSGVMNDAVSGFQFDIAGRGTLSGGTRESIAFIVAYGDDVAATVGEIDRFVAGRGADSILQGERDDWQSWLRSGKFPDTADPTESQVSLQSLAILRMGQVREPGAGHGQIIASLAPGMWDIAWVRDGLLAVRAFTATGHHDEAEAALDFYRRGPTGEYSSYVGRSYGLSVARYYGNGREESDWNANGPNVELDGFGMYLDAAAEHVWASGRTAWLSSNRAAIDDGVADVLVQFRDATTGLVAADSSIWESHWDNGGRQRWVYTSGFAVIGLRKWARLTNNAGYATHADAILAGMRAHLVDPATGALASSVEQLQAGDGQIADAQAALILAPESVTASSATGLATLDLLRQRLFLSNTTARGYKRNDDGDTYDEREWVVIDLGLSKALRAAGRVVEADALVAWITGQAAANHLLIPELFHQDDGRYFGEIPMVGFGGGAYLLALIDRDGTRAFDPPVDSDAGVTDAGISDASEPAVDGAMDAGISDRGSADATAVDSAAVDTGVDRDDASTGTGVVDSGARGRDGNPAPVIEQSECGCAHTSNLGAVHGLWLLLGLLLIRRKFD